LDCSDKAVDDATINIGYNYNKRKKNRDTEGGSNHKIRHLSVGINKLYILAKNSYTFIFVELEMLSNFGSA
jgi:hypothetical protein